MCVCVSGFVCSVCSGCVSCFWCSYWRGAVQSGGGKHFLLHCLGIILVHLFLHLVHFGVYLRFRRIESIIWRAFDNFYLICQIIG